MGIIARLECHLLDYRALNCDASSRFCDLCWGGRSEKALVELIALQQEGQTREKQTSYHERCHKGNKQDRMGNSVVVKDLRGRNTQAKTWRV